MRGKRTMITQTEHLLLKTLKSLDIDRETAVNISILARTDEKCERLMQAMYERYKEKGTVTDQDILKMLLIINGRLKTSTENTSMQ